MDLEVLPRGKGKLLFQSRKLKNGYGSIVYGEIREGSVPPPPPPPLDPPLVIEVANVDSTDGDCLMNPTN